MVTCISSIYPSHVSIYTSTMDPMGMFFVDFPKLSLEVRQKRVMGAFRMGFGHILDHWEWGWTFHCQHLPVYQANIEFSETCSRWPYCLYLFIVDSPGYQGTRVLTRNDMGTEWRSERDDPTHMEMEWNGDLYCFEWVWNINVQCLILKSTSISCRIFLCATNQDLMMCS